MTPPTSRYGHLDNDDLSIEGEVFSEADLASEDDLLTLTTPDGVDREWLMGELWKDLARGEHAQAVLMEAEMARLTEFNQQFEHGFVDGLGQTVARMPLSVALHWIARYGHEFWQQPENIDYFAARNPGFKIKSKGKTMIRVDGPINSSAPDSNAVPEGVGVNSSGVVQTAPVRGRPVSGKRGRWAL